MDELNAPGLRPRLLMAAAVIVGLVVAVKLFARKVAPGAASDASTPGGASGLRGGFVPEQVYNITVNHAPPLDHPSDPTAGTPGGGIVNPAPPAHYGGPGGILPPTRTSAPPRPDFVTVGTWGRDPISQTTLSGIASSHNESLAQLLGVAGNERYRANPNLIHPGDKVYLN